MDWLPVFINDQYFNIIIEALAYRQKRKKLNLFAYVFMRDHLHAILSADNLPKFMKEFKSFTAHKIVEQLKNDGREDILKQMRDHKKKYKSSSEYQVWQEGSHPQMIQSLDMFNQKAEYIHMNPVRNGYVKKPEDWKYSSATNYILGEGLLEIESIV